MTDKMRSKAKTLLGNRKVLLGTFAILSCAFLIGVCSFVPVIIDPNQIKLERFITDQLISIAIILSSMVSALFIAQASNANNPDSLLAKARVKFMELIGDVKKDINRFNQWVKKVLQPNDIKEIRERQLRSHGIEDVTILSLDESQIRALTKPQKYGDRFYKSLSDEQIKVILKIKASKNPTFVAPGYYLTCNKIIDSRTISERSASESAKKGAYMIRSILGKVIVALITSFIFASLARDLAESGNEVNTWVTFLSRIFNMCSSLFMGYILGVQLNNIDATYIEMKTDVHLLYLQDKDFVCLSEQEEAKQEFIARVKEEEHALLQDNMSKLPYKEN